MSHILSSTPSAPSMSFGPESSLLLSAPQEAHPQSLGTTVSNSTNTPQAPEYPDQPPSHPPHDNGGSHLPSLPQHGFTPQYSDPIPHQHSSDIPSVAMVSSELDRSHPVEDFHPYNLAQKPEARANRGLSKQVTPAESPEGKPNSNGRRRTRTKVVAWDPRDLEDIYVRKEVNKEEWDTICQDYPSRTRVAMRQQVIKLREKKQREAMGLGPATGKGSTYSDSPQPASNGIKWASVNGYQSSPAEADSYHQRQSVDGDESSDDFELSSAPDSDHEGKLTRQFDLAARSTPSYPPKVTMPDLPPQQPIVPSMPMMIPEGPQANGQYQPHFDVFAAQSRGQPIAPRQLPPKPTLTTAGLFDHAPSLAPDLRPVQRTKRNREFEAVDPDLRSTNNFNKRRKQQTETMDPSNPTVGVSEEFTLPFNPPQTIPMPLQTPPRLFSDADLDDMCMRFRDSFRMMGAYFNQEQRISKELFDAAINRANTRAAVAQQKLDEAHQNFADQAKEARLSSQIEYDNLSKKCAGLAEELTSCRQRLAKATPERKTDSAPVNNVNRPDVAMTAAPQPSLVEKLQQELRTVKEDAKRADVANNLLDEEAAKMRLDGRDTHSMIQEVKTLHDKLTTKIDHLASQDLQDLTHKEVKKFIMDVKSEDQELSIKVRQVEDFLSKPNHLIFGATHQPPDVVTNGFVTGGPS